MRSSGQNEQLKTLLQGAGVRPTRQRVRLASFLFDGIHKHVTAEQLYDAAHRAKNTVSLATVYNTLNQFTAAGLLREVTLDSAQVYFDTNIAQHHHFFDETTAALLDIPAEAIQVGRLPPPPKGCAVARVDVIVRVRSA